MRHRQLPVVERRAGGERLPRAGVASSWTLELPKGINDIDYGALTDVRLTFYYKARFDPDLRATVLAQLAALPGFTGRQRSLPTR